MLDQMDEEFGIGNLVKEDVEKERQNAYSHKDLRGLKVEHNLVSNENYNIWYKIWLTWIQDLQLLVF